MGSLYYPDMDTYGPSTLWGSGYAQDETFMSYPGFNTASEQRLGSWPLLTTPLNHDPRFARYTAQLTSDDDASRQHGFVDTISATSTPSPNISKPSKKRKCNSDRLQPNSEVECVEAPECRNSKSTTDSDETIAEAAGTDMVDIVKVAIAGVAAAAERDVATTLKWENKTTGESFTMHVRSQQQGTNPRSASVQMGND